MKDIGFNNFQGWKAASFWEAEIESDRSTARRFPRCTNQYRSKWCMVFRKRIDLCKDKLSMISYVEDPCGPEQGFFLVVNRVGNSRQLQGIKWQRT